MERKLASIQRIISIEPIEGADRIVLATVLGWQCVTQKSNNFKPDDLVVYFEVDSLIPVDNQVFGFLKDPVKFDQTHARLKTKRFKKQLSQGLILPLQEVLTLLKAGQTAMVSEGSDLTEALGIQKYERELPPQLRGVSKGDFPFFIPKTDETRIQTCPSVLTNRKGELFVGHEKLDGSSFTCYYYPYDTALQYGLPIDPEIGDEKYSFGVASRNLNLKKTDDNAFWKVAEKYELEKKLAALGRPLSIQGEMFGVGIQDNKLQKTTVDLAIFNVYDLVTKKYLNDDEVDLICIALGVPRVPLVYPPFKLDHTVEQLVIMSMVKSKLNPAVWAEGIVFRPLVESVEHRLGRLSFKVINPEFLIKFNE